MNNQPPPSPYETPKAPDVAEKPSGPLRVVTGFFVAVVGFLAGLYLLNPTAGLLELIPDNIPVVGNLDEAAAIGLLLSCLAYFGIDLNRIFGIFGFGRKTAEGEPSVSPKGKSMREAQGRVVD